jgi:hypothetical protein
MKCHEVTIRPSDLIAVTAGQNDPSSKLGSYADEVAKRERFKRLYPDLFNIVYPYG